MDPEKLIRENEYSYRKSEAHEPIILKYRYKTINHYLFDQIKNGEFKPHYLGKHEVINNISEYAKEVE